MSELLLKCGQKSWMLSFHLSLKLWCFQQCCKSPYHLLLITFMHCLCSLLEVGCKSDCGHSCLISPLQKSLMKYILVLLFSHLHLDAAGCHCLPSSCIHLFVYVCIIPGLVWALNMSTSKLKSFFRMLMNSMQVFIVLLDLEQPKPPRT